MRRVETLVVGAGQAGLAVSRCLAERGADHVVVERGRVAERWRTARWDSLRLITPNWMSRLPGWSYPGPDPDGYMSAPELVAYLQGYAESGAAPVRETTTVELVETCATGCTGPASSASGSTRCATRGRPAGRRPCNCPAVPIEHRRGVTRVPGLYVLGLRFLHPWDLTA